MSKIRGATKGKLQGLRGMPDLLPDETYIWQKIENTARIHFKQASILEIRTPLLEATELFARGIGESTDVVGKEMYSFVDRGDRNCTLRPEGTASIVRASIQHGLTKQGSQKLWYLGPMFRYERPQNGRQRQFHQIGVEYLGFADPRSDIELISIAWDFLNDLGLEKFITLEINSLGDKNDRSIYRTKLVDWLETHKEELDEDSKTRLIKNPLRILDTKNPKTKEILEKAPLLKDSLSKESINRFEKVKSGLTSLGIEFQENNNLVRGLDYYSHTAFEITSKVLGAQSTVCGGGRYDGLVQELGGPSTPSIGWAIGLERLVFLLSKEQPTHKNQDLDFYVVNRGQFAESLALIVSRKLRLCNQCVETDFSAANFTKQLKRADKSGARWAIIIGDDEAQGGQIILKDLRLDSSKVSKEEHIDIETLLKRLN